MKKKWLDANLDTPEIIWNEKGIAMKKEISTREIAVIGMALKMPLADNLEQFWNNLRRGVDCVREIPDNRKKDLTRYLQYKKIKVEQVEYELMAFLEEIDKFDYRFFNIPPKEASLIEPNQKLVLETAWEALEDAGYGGEKLVGSRTGVYLGFSANPEYKLLIAEIEPESLPLALTGNMPQIIASRISYLLDLRGPTILVDTTCSSSLVAVHLACQALRNGDCEMALAAGVKIHLNPIRTGEKIGIESSTGRTKAFDDHSDGTGSGEGLAVILLKPLTKAVEDRDHIYAVIKGNSINQDGKSMGITAPNPGAQEDVIIRAWQDAEINPETITYIEAHGTGTRLGDPVEIEGIQRAFQRYTAKKQFCAISALKSNIGHLDSATGIAGLVKAVLALKFGELPPTIHFQRPNRRINFEESPVYVNDRLMKWEPDGSPKRCGVSAFGLGGTNCHIILEEAPVLSFFQPDEEQLISSNLRVLALSAKSESALQELIKRYAAFITTVPDSRLDDICYTANTGRGHYNYRLAIIFRKMADLNNHLDQLSRVNFDEFDHKKGCYFGVHQIVHQRFEGEDGTGITQMEKDHLTRLLEQKIIQFVENGRQSEKVLEEICQLYIKGADQLWDLFYQGQQLQKLSLPVYPFERFRSFLEIPDPLRENRVNPLENLYYTLCWREQKIAPIEVKEKNGGIVILKDKTGRGDFLTKRFREKGRQVIEVEFGPNFQRIDSERFTIKGDQADFEKLLEEYKGSQLSQLIHLGALDETGESSSLEELEKRMRQGVYSLFNFMKATLKRPLNEELEMVLVSANAQEVTGVESSIIPENAALLGLGKVIGLENFHIKCRGIDIDANAGTDLLFQELQSGFQGQVAYRNGRRFIQFIKELDLSSVHKRDCVIQREGVYLITGGTGGLGLEIGKYLASKNKINLALISRKDFPPRDQWETILRNGDPKKLAKKIKTIVEIEQTGSQVRLYGFNIVSEKALREVLEELRQKYGRINGVIHCAGIAGDGFLIKKEHKVFTDVLAPKIAGTWILHHLLAEDQLDFFVMFSSVTSIVGGLGQGDYTAANAYLDSFSPYRRKMGQRALTINWAGWSETGMAVDYGINIDGIFKALPTITAISAFDQIFNTDLSGVIIGEINFDHEVFQMNLGVPIELSKEIRAKIERRRKMPLRVPENNETDKITEVELKGRKNGKYSKTEQLVARVWKKVLGFEIINVYDSFYELGGDSIQAMRIINILNQKMETRIEVTELMKFPTIAEFVASMESRRLKKDSSDSLFPVIQTVPIRNYYPVSSAQKRLFILDQLEDMKTAYNLPRILVAEGMLQMDQFKRAFQELMKRHEALRTSFEIIDGVPVQRIASEIVLKIEDWTLDDPVINSDQGVNSIVKEFIRPFDLSQAPLFRIGLVKLGTKKNLILFDIHHIIADGTSTAILVNEFIEFYQGNRLPELKIQYKEYAVWQNRLVTENYLQKQEEFWLKMFHDEIPILNLPLDYPRPELQSFIGDSIYFETEPELTVLLKKLAQETGTTLYMVLLASYYTLLFKYTGQEDIIVGVPLSSRSHLDLENVIGMFVNTLAFRNYPKGRMTFHDFLGEVRQNVLEVYENQEYQFEELVEKVKIQRDLTRNPLFDTMFVLQNYNFRRPVALKGLTFAPYEFEKKISRFDLSLEAYELGDQVEFNLEYCSLLFKRDTMERLIEHFLNTLRTVAQNSGQLLSQMDLLTAAEKRKLLFDFNSDQIEFDLKNKTVHTLFEEQVTRTPDHTAVVFGAQKVAYGELNARANQLAHYLKEKGVNRNSVVGLLMEPSIEMITGILGILKAGGAYLPVDPGYPKGRIAGMLDDSGASIILTKSAHIRNLPFTALQGFESNNTNILVTLPRPQIKVLDSLPIPDRSLVDYEKYNYYIGITAAKYTISLQATRGCPYNCIYCHKIWPKTHVFRTAEHIFEEVNLYYKMGVRRFSIIDDIFNLNIENSSKFFRLIIDHKLKAQLFFPNGLRGDILTKDYIDLMVEAGTINMDLALETASPRLQKMLRKNLDLAKLHENLVYITKKYPEVILELESMHGFPTETEEEAMMTMDFIKSIQWFHFPNLNILKIYPNTDMEKIALEHGVTKEAIENSIDLAFHELPDTLPFSKSFSLQYQAQFLNEYFLSKERILKVLPLQKKFLTKSELVQKYNSYLPMDINCFDDILHVFGVEESELPPEDFIKDDHTVVKQFNDQLQRHFGVKKSNQDALRILLIELSQFFTGEVEILYDVADAPLGLMYLLSYLNERFGEKVRGKIVKSRIDFNSYEELKSLVNDFKPEVIGIRTLTFYKNFFHKTVSLLRQWGVKVPIITGGPYATSSYQTILQDPNVDLIVLGEGEITLGEVLEKILANNHRLPDVETLKTIPGIAFAVDKEPLSSTILSREIMMLDYLKEELAIKSPENLHNVNEPSDMLYVIYTSGSTGQPKGSILEHRNLTNLLGYEFEKSGIDFNNKVLQFAPISFDVSFQEIFSCLLSGGELHLITKETRNEINLLFKYIDLQRISILFLPTSFIKLILNESDYCRRIPDTIRHIITAGEQLVIPETFKNYLISNGVFLHNHYGPTETHVVTTLTLDPCKPIPQIPTIGRPIANNKILILDENRQLKPLGIPGELYISGMNVGRGYLKRPELNQEKFLENPYEPGVKMYRTGDLARWTVDGNLEFIGRIDHQVKIRGFRIEPGEIESRLLKHGLIRKAVVVSKKEANGNHCLGAYFTADEKLSNQELRQYLSRTLPDYMIPSFFIQLEQIPLTPNRKVDLKLLPTPGAEQRDQLEFEAPRTVVEQKIKLIWEEVLGLKEIGPNVNFFEIGGHSINAIRIISRIMKEFNLEVPLTKIFQTQTIRNLAQYVNNTLGTEIFTKTKIISLLNNKKEKNIFCFPLMHGYGISYGTLAKFLDSYSLYAFDYIENEQRSGEYVKMMVETQPDGPFVLLAWSAGASLAFETAKELNRQGYQVSDLVLLDSGMGLRKTPFKFTEKECEKLITEYMEELKTWLPEVNQITKDNVIRRTKNRLLYERNVILSGQINTNIHMIMSVNGVNDLSGWDTATTKIYREYQGFGEHSIMLQHPEYTKRNAELISSILGGDLR